MADFSQPLLGAGAEAKNDWAGASAATSLSFAGRAQFRRGFEVEIGLNALATADAGLSKFIDATVRGNAFAEAKASLQCQLPLNLFDEFGIAVGAQAVAQAAAGIQVGLGLSVGDLVALIRQNPDSAGLPLDLVLLLLEEASVGGNFEVHVSAAAMAYASLLITGEVVKNPGFHILADAGAGLAAGVGFSGGLDLGIRDFRRFYGRAVDRTVDAVVEGLAPALARAGAQWPPLLLALAPAAKMSLRVAYELGDTIAKNSPGAGKQDAHSLANHCVGVLLEEAQRFLFGRFLEAGLRSLERLVTEGVPRLAQGEWERLEPQRAALAAVLRRMPAEPFQPTPENATYWLELANTATDLVGRLPAAAQSDEVTRGLAMAFSAAALTLKAVESRVNQARAYAFAIGAGRVTSPPPSFTGALALQPTARIRAHINRALGRGDAHALDYADLIAYLVSDGAITALRTALPAVDGYLAIFQQPAVGNTLSEVLRALLESGEAFIRNDSGELDPQETLRVLLGALDAFITRRIGEELVPAVEERVADDALNLYFREVIVAALVFVKEVAFRTVLDWERKPVDQDAFKEALAGVMTMLLGRSLVLVGDGFLAALQGDMQRACGEAAGKLSGPNDPFQAMGIAASPELRALLADTLRVGGEVFGPLPEAARWRLRSVLYDVMETLPPGAAEQADLLENLADQFFIPNREAVDALADELLSISRDRFRLFVERVLQAGGELILDAIREFVEQATEAVLEWAEELDRSLRVLRGRLEHLDEQVQELAAQAEQAFEQVAQELEALLEMLARRSVRDRVRGDVADQIYARARDLLADNLVYRNLPADARRAVREALKGVVRGLVEGPVLDPAFEAIGAVAGELDGLLDDVQALNPRQPLGPQLLDLLIDRMEDGIRDLLGGSGPSWDVGLTMTVLGFSQRFSLGRIRLPFEDLFRILRAAVDGLGFVQGQLEATAGALERAFRLAVDLHRKQAQRGATQERSDRLGRIRDEFSAQRKSITILNPVPSLVYDDDLTVQVHLGGVPASYLGIEEDEQQRVLVFLNGRLIPAQAFAFGKPSARPDGAGLPSPAALGAAGAAGGSPAAALAVSAPQPALAIRPLLGATGRGTGARPAQPVARQAVQRSPAGRLVTTGALTNVLPGRRMTPSKLGRLQEGLPAGMLLEFRAERGQLVAGSNTLAVVVIDPGGQRYQQAVSFGVAAEPKQGPHPPAARLPEMPWNRRKGLPAAPANRLAAHYDRYLIANRLSRGQALVVRAADRLKRLTAEMQEEHTP